MRPSSFESARKLIHLVGGLIPLIYLLLNLTKPQALLILGCLALPFILADVLRLRWPALNHWFLHLFQGAIEFARLVFEDSEVRNFRREGGKVVFTIPFGDADKYKKALPNAPE